MKVALSGLFSRFVARAYLERYFDLSIFAHLGSRVVDLDRRKRAKIERLARGDLPDWIASKSDLTSLTIAEAKGCYDLDWRGVVLATGAARLYEERPAAFRRTP